MRAGAAPQEPPQLALGSCLKSARGFGMRCSDSGYSMSAPVRLVPLVRTLRIVLTKKIDSRHVSAVEDRVDVVGIV